MMIFLWVFKKKINFYVQKSGKFFPIQNLKELFVMLEQQVKKGKF